MSNSFRHHGLQHARLSCPSQLLEPSQTHVHRVGDAIQPSHPLLSPSPPAFSLSSIRVFSSEAISMEWPKYGASASASVLPMNTQDWFPLGLTGWISLQSKDSQESSPAPQFKSISSSVLSFLYGPTLTSIHDIWTKLPLKLESYFSQWNNWYLSLLPSFCAIYVQLCSPQSQISEGAKTQHHITDYNFI